MQLAFLLSDSATIKECVQGACYIQECAPENLDLKKKIMLEIDELLVDDNTIVASSTSSFPASTFSAMMKHRGQVIVAHPVSVIISPIEFGWD